MFTQKQIDLFWSNVDIRSNDECWNWKLSIDHSGYGKVKIGVVVYIAHRIAYRFTYGGISDGKHVLHSCDNPKCCNPYHLFEGTHLQNMQDMISKGRQIKKGITFTYKLDYEKAESIRKEYSQGSGTNALARKYGVAPKHIRDILKGVCWKPPLPH